MLHLFVSPGAIREDGIDITGGDVNHIRNVLRMKEGEELTVSDGKTAVNYLCRIAEFTPDTVRLSIISAEEKDTELPVKVLLFQGLPKAEKMEWIIQKTTELGVSEIIPVSNARSVVKLDADRGAKKTKRWQSIAESAAEQSRRRIVPTVREPVSFSAALRMAEGAETKLIPYERFDGDADTKELLRGIRPGSTVAVFIGPEGGYEPSEIEEARAAGVVPVTLGKRILRTETAGIAALSFIVYELEL